MKINSSISLVFAIIALAISGCTPSKEEKAEVLVNDIMKQYLLYPDSYESISTRVDSAFVSIYTDLKAYRAAIALRKLQDDEERDLIEYELNRAKSLNALWSLGGQNAFALEGRRQAQQEIAKYEKELKEFDEKIEKQRNIIKQRADSIHNGAFCGWRIIHNYRCENDLGEADVSRVLFVVDPEIARPIFFSPLDNSDEDNFQTIKEIIDSVLE